MLKMQNKAVPSTHKNDRRRGRPAGKNRTPLSLEERRARNALYERERRNETADAMAQLAEAARCQPEISNAELLATVISQLQRRAKRKLPEDIEDMKRVNQSLESQIAALQSRLGHDVDLDEKSDNPTDNEHLSKPDSPKTDTRVRRSRKFRKTSKCSSVREKSSSESISSSDSSSDSSNSSWSESQATEIKYQLRMSRPKLSEQSECTTSTYLKTESEWSQSSGSPVSDQNSENSCQSEARSDVPVNEENQVQSIPDIKQEPEEFEENLVMETKPLPDTGDRLNDPFLPAIPELEDEVDYKHQSETLTEGEEMMLSEWLDRNWGRTNVMDVSDHQDNKARKFLDFDDFLTSY